MAQSQAERVVESIRESSVDPKTVKATDDDEVFVRFNGDKRKRMSFDWVNAIAYDNGMIVVGVVPNAYRLEPRTNITV